MPDPIPSLTVPDLDRLERLILNVNAARSAPYPVESASARELWRHMQKIGPALLANYRLLLRLAEACAWRRAADAAEDAIFDAGVSEEEYDDIEEAAARANRAETAALAACRAAGIVGSEGRI